MSTSLARRRLLALLPLLALAGCGAPTAKYAPVPRGATVLALGDSLTFGTGASEATSYPTALAERTGWQVENAGVPGETAREICARMPGLLGEHRPALVIVLAGGNDFLRRLPETGIREALSLCAAHARASSVPLVLLPVPRLGIGRLVDAPLYADAAATLGLPLVDARLAELLGQPAMRADAVHLNATGYAAMASNVASGLEALGFLR